MTNWVRCFLCSYKLEEAPREAEHRAPSPFSLRAAATTSRSSLSAASMILLWCQRMVCIALTTKGPNPSCVARTNASRAVRQQGRPRPATLSYISYPGAYNDHRLALCISLASLQGHRGRVKQPSGARRRRVVYEYGVCMYEYAHVRIGAAQGFAISCGAVATSRGTSKGVRSAIRQCFLWSCITKSGQTLRTSYCRGSQGDGGRGRGQCPVLGPGAEPSLADVGR